jgi:hypothetical protein
MVYGDLRHSSHECEVAQKPTDGHRQMYVAREAGHHVTPSDRGVKWEIWEWTCVRIALIQRTDQREIPQEWLLCPCCQLWPP